MTRTTHSARGFLVVRRLNWALEYPNSIVAKRSPAVHLSSDDVARRYSGFEGDLWPGTLFAKVPKNEFELVEQGGLDMLRRILADLGRSDEYDLIYLECADLSRGLGRVEPSRFLGYDCGYFESSFNKYSVLLNEVIFGEYDELRSFAGQLNEHLLFQSPEPPRFLAKARENLLAKGADLEANARCIPVSIMRPPEEGLI